MSLLPPFNPGKIKTPTPAIPAIPATPTTNRPSKDRSKYPGAVLPFPVGLGGLPMAQVQMAETIQEKLGIQDPVLRKYNILSWVRTHLQYQSLNHGQLYEAILAEQKRLGEILAEDEAERKRRGSNA